MNESWKKQPLQPHQVDHRAIRAAHAHQVYKVHIKKAIYAKNCALLTRNPTPKIQV